ncbi:Alkaline phosphatase D precursor [Caulifigura coniformis]|uniref:Alkaline phosphatase D n=1 Tax=Caulifigura coniformis TaxID=2527983 RepID=A0A517SLJ8_9PLAN|nr:alkaline phosphatase D family protein [Caulifigura coniformis]QDT56988.1 Alkaline phosphatase D precursor [Caulifigura coniformis]
MTSNTDTPISGIARREFLAGAVALGAGALVESVPAQSGEKTPLLGPILGHADAESAMVWMRAQSAGEYTLEVFPESGGPAQRMKGEARDDGDLCLQWRVTGLKPGSRFRYRIVQGERVIAGDERQVLSTAPKPGAPSKVRLAISSCAKEDAGSRDVWNGMAGEDVEAVVLIGDTPYIDSTELATQTSRHREFAAVPEYQALLRSRPCWWTWDDHDFAGNDSSGIASGKENSRLVVTRYRPQKEYGDGEGGIYTSFRRGPVEVFLLDTRWYSMTEPSFAAPHKPTLLGAKQWEWLKQGLLASTAPFKLLACGVIWDDKENSESDDWGTYKHELTAIQKFIGANKIAGVVLVGGDIHASRVLRYKTEKTVGYELVQFIASPIHGSTIPSLNVYHPDLVRSAVEPHVFLRVDADDRVTPARLDASLINRKGETVFSYHVTADDLRPKA